MSLTTVLNTAVSGLQAAQIGLRTVSDNIANVNTPGYVRKTVDQAQLVAAGQGMGVQITGVKRVTDQYLQLASLTASSDSSRWGTVSQYMDNAQSLFGDPSGKGYFFSRLDDIWSAFSAAADDPSSSLSRSQAISNVQDFLAEGDRINSQINQLGQTVDTQVDSDVSRANALLQNIDKLNTDIARAKTTGGDSSGSENIQSQMVDELATLMNVRVIQRPQGGVAIRSTEGVMLAGDGAATLIYNHTDTTRGYISATAPGGGVPSDITVTSGDIRGLLDLRDTELPSLSNQLGEFMTRTTDAINAAHNASTSTPAPATLTGRNTGLDQASAIAGFSGASTVVITDASGVVQRRVDIDFTANTMSVNGGGPTAFSDGTFAADLTTALGAYGSASFAGGALTINASGAGNGVAISPGTATNAGKGFSQFMGLNDLIRSTNTNFDTGLTGTSPNGFVAGGELKLRIAQPDGKPLSDLTVTMPGGGDMNSLLTTLNSTTGVGLYGQFSLNSNGALSFNPTQPLNANISVISDNTQRGAGGPSFSALFGVGVAAQTSRAGRFTVDQAIVSDPTKLALAQLDLTVAAGQPAVRPGDGTGAQALATAGDTVENFSAAGDLGAVSMSVSRYAAEFGGSIGRNAASAESQQKSADAVKTEADQRRESVEGVNIDEELVRLTTYQQAFNASARMIQAAKDMFDVLSGIV